MSKTELLRALQAELQFLGQGGYGQAFRSPWRPTILLRDSVLCPNAISAPVFRPCTECKLLPLVPLEKRNVPNPCHHIPLNAAGETLAELYEKGTQKQADRVYREWLCATIEKLEREADMNAIETCTNVSFKNILFLTDLTEASQAAYTYALALARQYHAIMRASIPRMPFQPASPQSWNSIPQRCSDRRRTMPVNSSPDW